MRYDFYCEKCKMSQELVISAEEVNKNKNWNKIKCQSCSNLMIQDFNNKNVGVIFNQPSAGQLVKRKRDAQKTQEIANQDLTPMEINELPDIAKEEAKKRGTTAEHILGGVKMPQTTEQKAAARERAKRKKEDSQKSRKGLKQ